MFSVTTKIVFSIFIIAKISSCVLKNKILIIENELLENTKQEETQTCDNERK